jgi:hypothetical protein
MTIADIHALTLPADQADLRRFLDSYLQKKSSLAVAKEGKDLLLLGCILSRAESSGALQQWGYPSIHQACLRLKLEKKTARVAVGLYQVLRLRKFSPAELDEINANLRGRYRAQQLLEWLKLLKTKEECLQIQKEILHRDRKKRVTERQLARKIPLRYKTPSVMLGPHAADLSHKIRKYLKKLDATEEDVEIIKSLSVKVLLEHPSEEELIRLCYFYGLRKIFIPVLQGRFAASIKSRYINLSLLREQKGLSVSASLTQSLERIDDVIAAFSTNETETPSPESAAGKAKGSLVQEGAF